MPTKIEGRSSHHELIDDIVEATPSSSVSNSRPLSIMDGSKTLQNKSFSSYSNIPGLYNNKSKLEQTDNSTTTLTNELRDRLHLTLPRSSSSSTILNNDERRKELDFVLKHLYDGKLLTSINDDRLPSELSESSIPILNRTPITTTTTNKNDDENKINIGNIELLSFDEDATSLQRELQEKELDIIHLHKEIQELQLDNKLLKAKVPTVYQNGHISNNTEIEVLRREKDVLQNELTVQQELVAKLQQQQHQNGIMNRSNKLDEVTLHQKEALEKKLKIYEKQIRTLTTDNEKLTQHLQQTDHTILQLKKENEELQQKKINKKLSILLSLLDPAFAPDTFFPRQNKFSQVDLHELVHELVLVNEAKKRNDELLYQEFNALRNDLKILKQRNDELFEENRRLQQEQRRQEQNLAWRSTLQQAFATEPPPPPQQQQQQQGSHKDNIPPPPPLKSPDADSRRERPKVTRSESPNMSEASDSTNYLTSVSVERYNNRPLTSIHRSATVDGNNHHRTSRYSQPNTQDEFNRSNYSNSLSKSIDSQGNYRSSKVKRTVEWDEENIQQNEGPHHRDNRYYDDQHRFHRQHSPDRTNDYMSSSSSSAHLYNQQNYGLTRSVTLPDSQHHSRRTNTYNTPNRPMHNDTEQHDDRHHSRRRRPSVETTSPRRPYAPSSINDIRLNDLIKFSRPGGKISKGVVKYIGTLPGKSDQYLGLELEDEESKHDGIYQGQRLFQCKPNKGVFVGFSKVIMAWSGK